MKNKRTFLSLLLVFVLSLNLFSNGDPEREDSGSVVIVVDRPTGDKPDNKPDDKDTAPAIPQDTQQMGNETTSTSPKK